MADGETKALEGVAGDACELAIEIEVGAAQRCGLKVRASPSGEEETLLYYDADKKELVFDSTRSGKEGRKGGRARPVCLEARRAAEAAGLRGQVGRGGLCQRPPSHQPPRLSGTERQPGSQPVRQRRHRALQDREGLGNDARKPVLNPNSEVGQSGFRSIC